MTKTFKDKDKVNDSDKNAKVRRLWEELQEKYEQDKALAEEKDDE